MKDRMKDRMKLSNTKTQTIKHKGPNKYNNTLAQAEGVTQGKD